MPSPVAVRSATRADVPALAAIWAEGIEDRLGTFRTDPPRDGEAAGWLGERGPVLVAERDGEVIGWSRVLLHLNPPFYADIGEYTIYVTRSARGEGIGSALLPALVDAARAAGYHKLVGLLFATNAASRSLAARCGFREVGTYARHAQLDGEWRDVVAVERTLRDG